MVLVLSLTLLAACGDDPDRAAGEPETRPPPPTVGDPSPPGPSPVQRPDLEAFRGRLVRVATLQEPLALASRVNDPRLFVAQKTGEVMVVEGDGAVASAPLVDLSEEVSQGFEQGLLGLAFSPDGAHLYLNFTDAAGDTRIVEFAMVGSGVDPASRREVLFIDQPFPNHNGGNLLFGPDGYLYVGMGDGGSAGDPMDNGQNLGSMLGKMLRIDPRPSGGQGYAVPGDNPFVGREDARPEVFAYGLRNPWRYSFDRGTGDLWIGDVGQNALEEVDVLRAGDGAGANLGWNAFEGSEPFEPPQPTGTVRPVHEYGPELGRSIVGGFVYRGAALPALQGAYVFGDFYNAQIRAIVPEGRGFSDAVELGLAVPDLTSFGEDAAGELYALSISGPVYRIEA